MPNYTDRRRQMRKGWRTVAEPLLYYVCSKCKGKTLRFHLVSDGRIVCHPRDSERRKFIENYDKPNAPK